MSVHAVPVFPLDPSTRSRPAHQRKPEANHELNPPELRPVRVQGLGGGSPIAGQTSRWEGVGGLLRGLPLMSLALFAGTLVQYSA